jgi:hypothetical protein
MYCYRGWLAFVTVAFSLIMLFACGGAKQTSDIPDTTPPVISSVQATGIQQDSATITWTTDELSTSQVEYGLDTGYGQTTTLDPSLLTSHSVLVSSLSASTQYHYRVISRDDAGNEATGADNMFTTTGSGGANSTILNWNSNIEADLAGYIIYYGTASGTYDTQINVGNVTTYTVEGLTGSTTYYFAVRAYDTSANLSDFSTEATKDIP